MRAMKHLSVPVTDQKSLLKPYLALDEPACGVHEALARLKALEGPVASVQTMIEESVAGRYS
jgi:hypothetical protein